MPTYQYRCRDCRSILERFFHHEDGNRHKPPACPSCNGRMVRKFSFTTAESFEPHFNHSVGAFVTSKGDMRDKLKASAAERSERLGVDHSYEMFDKAEVTRDDVGVDDAGMRETHDMRVKMGLQEPTGKTVM